VQGTASGPLCSERGSGCGWPKLGGFGGMGTDMATSEFHWICTHGPAMHLRVRQMRQVVPRRRADRGAGPMGVSRLRLSKPVIAAVTGYAVAGGLEPALWCDLRVADETAVFGVFCRRWGVPLIDGGTVRLPRLIGTSRATDMILTGRAVDAREAIPEQPGSPPERAATARSAPNATSPRSQTAWLPQSCRWNCMAAAAMSYEGADRGRGRSISGHGSPPARMGHRKPETTRHQCRRTPRSLTRRALPGSGVTESGTAASP
jgi:hypothetical protein